MASTLNHWEVKPAGIGLNAEDLWEAACRYFQWCEANPTYKPELLRAGPRTGETIYMAIPRAFNIAGLCLHLGITVKYIKEMARSEDNGDYYWVAQRILATMYAQKLENAIAGVYNPVFVAKELRVGEDNEVNKSAAVIRIFTLENGAPKLLQNEQETKI